MCRARHDEVTSVSAPTSSTTLGASSTPTQHGTRSQQLKGNPLFQPDHVSDSEARASLMLSTDTTNAGVEVPSVDNDFSSFKRKLGSLVLWTMLGGDVIIWTILGFWAFLWHADNTNPTWHYIVAGDHMKVVITATAEVVNRLLGLMIGAECSMVIALALERSEVLFPSTASAASGRSGLGGGKWFSLMKKLVQGKWPCHGWKIGLPVLVVFISLVDNLSLGTSPILFSDINLGQVATRNTSSDIHFGFQYQPSTITQWNNMRSVVYGGNTWGRKALSYPAFAEYREPPVLQDGTSDTGVTLRAFLPFDNNTRRAQLHSYSGRTTVLDARVTCQVPSFSNLTIQVLYGAAVFSGFVRATRYTPRLGNATLAVTPDTGGLLRHDVAVPFVCVAPLFVGEGGGLSDQWRTGLCQMANDVGNARAGGLVSEFKDYSTWFDGVGTHNESSYYGTGYLAFNMSTGVEFVWQELYGPYGATAYSDPPPVDISGAPTEEIGPWLRVNLKEDLQFESTLCYSAFDTADLPVKITSTTERNTSEPIPRFDFTSLRYTFDDVRWQYGQKGLHHSLALADRGVLTLHRQNWTAPAFLQPPLEPYIRQFVNMAGPTSEGNDGGWSTLLCETNIYSGSDNLNASWYDINVGATDVNILQPDPMHIWLFQEIIADGGSIAFAIQSLITLLSSMAYYDQLGQFDNVAAVALSSFRTTNVPTRWWGWLAVTIYLVIHLVISWIVLIWFVKETRYTLLGETWQGLSQAVTTETMPYLMQATALKDDELKETIKRDWLSKERVRLGPGADGRVAIYLDQKEEPDFGYSTWPHISHTGKYSSTTVKLGLWKRVVIWLRLTPKQSSVKNLPDESQDDND